MHPVRAWLPYILVGILLLMTRLPMTGVGPALKSWTVGWERILDTDAGKIITPLYNPGILPFLFVAILIPYFHRLRFSEAREAFGEAFKLMAPASAALIFTLAMVYIMMNSGEAAGRDSMLIVLARAAAAGAGDFWLLAAPFVGALGTFISGSNTVSNIMFGPLQFDTAMAADTPLIPTLALQAVGGAAGNMICIHNVVAVLTTVGLVGREGLIIRKNIKVCLAYCILAGIFGLLLAGAV